MSLGAFGTCLLAGVSPLADRENLVQLGGRDEETGDAVRKAVDTFVCLNRFGQNFGCRYNSIQTIEHHLNMASIFWLGRERGSAGRRSNREGGGWEQTAARFSSDPDSETWYACYHYVA